jgi:hypothetical protein
MNPDGSNVFKLTNSVPIVDLIQILLNFSWNTSGVRLYPILINYIINNDGGGFD